MRMLRTATAAGAALLILAAATTGAGASTTQPTASEARQLAVNQTRWFWSRWTNAAPSVQRPTCRTSPQGAYYFLPVHTNNVGSTTNLHCTVAAGRPILADVGGWTVDEDPFDGPDPCVLDFSVFTPCTVGPLASEAAFTDDVGGRVVSSITLDGHALTKLKVITGPFRTGVPKPGTGTLTLAQVNYQDSVKLGHPGWITIAYAGYKAVFTPSVGDHVVRVSIRFGPSSPASVIYYHLTVTG
jgi:hypothetical protein